MDPDAESPEPSHPRRPTRLDRVFVKATPVYFVTFNTYRRVRILARVELHSVFIDFCRRAERHSIAVGRYVIMPDHVHVFVAMPEVGNVSLSHWIKALKNVLGKALLMSGVDKPHWQEGFFDHLIRNDESHVQKWDYVRCNPVRAGLCREPQDWPFKGEIVAL